MKSFPKTHFRVEHPGKPVPQRAGVGWVPGACTAELRNTHEGQRQGREPAPALPYFKMFTVHPNIIPGQFFKGELYSGIKTLWYTSRHGGKTSFRDSGS